MSNPDDGFHMFGYYDKSPWSPDESKILYGKIPSYNSTLHWNARPMMIGIADFDATNAIVQNHRFIDSTKAWNHQQGTMLQWVGTSNELIIFNDRACDGCDSFFSVIHNVRTGVRERLLSRPVYSLNLQGTMATSLNFALLHLLRVGYGYALSKPVMAKHKARTRCPDDDGIFLIDTRRDESFLLVSMREVWEHVIRHNNPTDPTTGLPYTFKLGTEILSLMTTECYHWINHAQFNKEGDKLIFLYRVGRCRDSVPRKVRSRNTLLFMIDIHTRALWRVPATTGSHHDFGWNGTAVILTGEGYFEARFNRSVEKLNMPDFLGNGHCTYSPFSHDILLSDTTPLLNNSRKLFIWNRKSAKLDVLGFFNRRLEGREPTRVDLHPRWSRSGRFVCFDSTHEGLGRQVYFTEALRL